MIGAGYGLPLLRLAAIKDECNSQST